MTFDFRLFNYQNSPLERGWGCVFLSCKFKVYGLQLFLVYFSIQKTNTRELCSNWRSNRWSSIVNPFFFLDEKETKNQDLGFSAIKIGSLPKTQKLPRSRTHGIKQFEFLYGSFAFLILTCQIQWSEKSPVVLLCILEFGNSELEFLIRSFVSKTSRSPLPTSHFQL